jgi:hypothetical protein
MRSWGERRISLSTKSPTVADHTAPAIGASVLISFSSACSGSATLPRMLRSAEIRSVTVGDFRRSNALLEVFCSCGHHARIDPQQTTWPDEIAVPQVDRLMRCSKCGGRPNNTRPDCRTVSATGKYPAF